MKYTSKISTRFSDYNLQKILKASTQFDLLCEACKEFFEIKLGYNIADLAKKSLRCKITEYQANYIDDISYRENIDIALELIKTDSSHEHLVYRFIDRETEYTKGRITFSLWSDSEKAFIDIKGIKL